ncbi:CapA family protein [Ruania alba]|uniref:Poly-gamma-glutamate synthesis protein (Capsule biosynthesis protein) n=1 Tax=Ruania alba TaxID=648782 RepID=A0A1H5E4Z9_9MICO|nr:CapA family protein [Ruania alba]SED86191.1 poly-gamma-glutamate synthesis protein (capsule biosynthesis protein) [Ruania alba]
MRPRRRHSWVLPAVLTATVLLAYVGAATHVYRTGPGAEPSAPPSSTVSSTSPATPTTSPEADPSDPADDEAIFTIGAAGDVLPHDAPIETARTDDGYDFTPMLEATRAWSSGADLALCNMEVPLALPGEEPSGYPLFGAPGELPGTLAELGWDGCSTGTNHSLDRGLDNLTHTLDVFDEAGLGHAGTARSRGEADTPQLYRLERAGQQITVAQVGGTYGTNGLPIPADAPWAVTLLDAEALIAQARTAREAGADLVVATLHWGEEYQHSPNADQRSLAAALAESGQVDLVIGTHPHVPQPFALLDGGPDGSGMWVAYSLGNFISNQDDDCCVPQTATGLFLTATVVKRADGPARVTGMEWSPMTVDREGGQHVYPLRSLTSGAEPDGLTLSPSELSSRLDGVQEVMAESTGATFPERHDPPAATGPEPEVVPRS